MKKSDIALIILVTSISMGISYFVVNKIPALHPPEEGIKVKVIDKYSSDISKPDENTFGDSALNPTVPVQITGADSTDENISPTEEPEE